MNVETYGWFHCDTTYTLDSIARRYAISDEAIKFLNPALPDVVPAGTYVKVRNNAIPLTAPVASVNLNEQLSPHFHLWEFRCKCYGKYPDCQTVDVNAALIVALETLRSKFYPRGLSIVSGYRCPLYNASLNGSATNSQHLYGNAADIVPIVGLAQVRALNIFSGIGVVRKTSRVSHVDVRHAGQHNLTSSIPSHPAIWYYE